MRTCIDAAARRSHIAANPRRELRAAVRRLGARHVCAAPRHTYLAVRPAACETAPMGVVSRLAGLDDSVARRWPGLFSTSTRRRFGTMIAYQIVAAVALFVGAGTGSWMVGTIAVYPVLATLVELVRLMPGRDEDAATDTV